MSGYVARRCAIGNKKMQKHMQLIGAPVIAAGATRTHYRWTEIRPWAWASSKQRVGFLDQPSRAILSLFLGFGARCC